MTALGQRLLPPCLRTPRFMLCERTASIATGIETTQTDCARFWNMQPLLCVHCNAFHETTEFLCRIGTFIGHVQNLLLPWVLCGSWEILGCVHESTSSVASHAYHCRHLSLQMEIFFSFTRFIVFFSDQK